MNKHWTSEAPKVGETHWWLWPGNSPILREADEEDVQHWPWAAAHGLIRSTLAIEPPSLLEPDANEEQRQLELDMHEPRRCIASGCTRDAVIAEQLCAECCAYLKTGNGSDKLIGRLARLHQQADNYSRIEPQARHEMGG